jgi:hypothetical protein
MSSQIDGGESSESKPPTTTTAGNAPAKPGAKSGPAAAVTEDLAAEIALQVKRLPADRVSCRRVSGNYYRCNWWSRGDTSQFDNPEMGGLTVTTHVVRKSAFLHVVKSRDGLSIDAIDGRVTDPDRDND